MNDIQVPLITDLNFREKAKQLNQSTIQNTGNGNRSGDMNRIYQENLARTQDYTIDNLFNYSADDLETVRQIDRTIQETKGDVAIFPGQRLDPDSIGTGLALAESIASPERKVTLLVAEDVPQHLLSFKPDNVEIKNFNKEEINPENYNLAITVDVGDQSAMTKEGFDLFKGIQKQSPSIQVDHHSQSDKNESMNPGPGDNQNFIQFIDNSEAPSAGNMIARYFQGNNKPISKSMANNLLLAVMGDTGGLIHEKGSDPSKISGYVSFLVKHGAEFEKVNSVINYLSDNTKKLINTSTKKQEESIITTNSGRRINVVSSFISPSDINSLKAKASDLVPVSSNFIYRNTPDPFNKDSLPTLSILVHPHFKNANEFDPTLMKVSMRASKKLEEIGAQEESILETISQDRNFSKSGGGHRGAGSIRVEDRNRLDWLLDINAFAPIFAEPIQEITFAKKAKAAINNTINYIKENF